MQIYKVCDIYKNGAIKGSIFATEPDEEWFGGLRLMVKVTQKITIKYGHVQYRDADDNIILSKGQINSFKRLFELWKKRRMRYAKWNSFGAPYRGVLGYYYAKPFSENDVEMKKEDRPKDITVNKKEQVKGFNKVKEIYANKELTSELFKWEGYTVEFVRHQLGIKGKNQGLIIPYYEIEALNEMFISAIDTRLK